MKKSILLFAFVFLLLVALSGAFIHFSNEKEVALVDEIDYPPLRVALISDIDRCKTRRFSTAENLNRFVDFANTQSVDFAVSLGDNVAHRLEDCTLSAQDDLAFVMNAFSRIARPVHYVLGDHDLSEDPDSYALWLEKTDRPKTYYTFTHHDVRIIILDTVAGGVSMLSCKDDPVCKKKMMEVEQVRSLITATPTLPKKERLAHEAHLITLAHDITWHNKKAKYIRDDLVRDHGLVDYEQLLWLSRTLQSSDQEKVLILSDHPLFALTTVKKSYEINNLAEIDVILQDAVADGKSIVSVAGEVHHWKKEEIGGVTYYTVDQFRAEEGSWAYAQWDDQFTLGKVRGDVIDKTF